MSTKRCKVEDNHRDIFHIICLKTEAASLLHVRFLRVDPTFIRPNKSLLRVTFGRGCLLEPDRVLSGTSSTPLFTFCVHVCVFELLSDMWVSVCGIKSGQGDKIDICSRRFFVPPFVYMIWNDMMDRFLGVKVETRQFRSIYFFAIRRKLPRRRWWWPLNDPI